MQKINDKDLILSFFNLKLIINNIYKIFIINYKLLLLILFILSITFFKVNNK